MEYLEKYGRKGGRFVETGLWLGEAVELALQWGAPFVWSIELDEALVNDGRQKFWGRPVGIMQGDSAEVLPRILPFITEPATFWLDGHYGDRSPLLSELSSIAAHPIKTHTIIIDDVRIFSHPGWPSREEVESALMAINFDYGVRYLDGQNAGDILCASMP